MEETAELKGQANFFNGAETRSDAGQLDPAMAPPPLGSGDLLESTPRGGPEMNQTSRDQKYGPSPARLSTPVRRPSSRASASRSTSQCRPSSAQQRQTRPIVRPTSAGSRASGMSPSRRGAAAVDSTSINVSSLYTSMRIRPTEPSGRRPDDPEIQMLLRRLESSQNDCKSLKDKVGRLMEEIERMKIEYNNTVAELKDEIRSYKVAAVTMEQNTRANRLDMLSKFNEEMDFQKRVLEERGSRYRRLGHNIRIQYEDFLHIIKCNLARLPDPHDWLTIPAEVIEGLLKGFDDESLTDEEIARIKKEKMFQNITGEKIDPDEIEKERRALSAKKSPGRAASRESRRSGRPTSTNRNMSRAEISYSQSYMGSQSMSQYGGGASVSICSAPKNVTIPVVSDDAGFMRKGTAQLSRQVETNAGKTKLQKLSELRRARAEQERIGIIRRQAILRGQSPSRMKLPTSPKLITDPKMDMSVERGVSRSQSRATTPRRGPQTSTITEAPRPLSARGQNNMPQLNLRQANSPRGRPTSAGRRTAGTTNTAGTKPPAGKSTKPSKEQSSERPDPLNVSEDAGGRGSKYVSTPREERPRARSIPNAKSKGAEIVLEEFSIDPSRPIEEMSEESIPQMEERDEVPENNQNANLGISVLSEPSPHSDATIGVEWTTADQSAMSIDTAYRATLDGIMTSLEKQANFGGLLSLKCPELPEVQCPEASPNAAAEFIAVTKTTEDSPNEDTEKWIAGDASTEPVEK